MRGVSRVWKPLSSLEAHPVTETCMYQESGKGENREGCESPGLLLLTGGKAQGGSRGEDGGQGGCQGRSTCCF